MDFAAFAERADELEAEGSDLGTVALVADLLADAGDELPVVARFLRGEVFAGWDSRKLSVGPALCYEAIARAAGRNVSVSDVEARLADTGEIGAVAANYEFGGQTGLSAFAGGSDGDGGAGGDLTVRGVADSLAAVAAATGEGSEATRRDTLFGLFNRASPAEAKYLARLLLGEMRIGVGGGTVRDATAAAFLGAETTTPVDERGEKDDEKREDDAGTEADDDERGDDGDGDGERGPEDESADGDESEGERERETGDDTAELVAAVERALQVTNDYGRVAELAREEGVAGLRSVSLEVGRPVRAMLAQAGTVADALDGWDAAAVETKYDGARVQLHYDGESASVFSRNMEDVTDALPELVEHAERELSAPAIVDGEAVAVGDDGRPLPFQEVLRRFRRKHDVDRMREEVAVELRAFDCLHAAGEDLLDTPLTERHDRLRDVLDTGVSDLLVSDDPDEIAAFETDALEAGHEGVMLKRPDSTYSPGRRGRNWLKRKPDVETLDLVVTGAEWGEGRRATYLGTFLLSARVEGRGDPEYETIGKVATGITDEELAELTDLLEPHVVRESGTEVAIRPAVVFEVGYEEIQRSPTYSSGYALRFPRFLGVREDKAPGDADTLERVDRLADAG
ncbi:ATP-dependent DNA ligase LigA [Candidatus Halobonum tyrrellensis]|uniref:DNA ligase n=1 Tax=Candidatus Halobonum tyrrellensis G22 TaxID=1324957 RepID=V4HF55_9EURY|nr:ATP-dependent DNA ligase LigA [Candidatus Halobonum tyrrellensis]ESP88743.1 ATP-dependent DNA ligase i [Candidatus Halobonum tyrrellensis G22]